MGAAAITVIHVVQPLTHVLLYSRCSALNKRKINKQINKQKEINK